MHTRKDIYTWVRDNKQDDVHMYRHTSAFLKAVAWPLLLPDQLHTNTLISLSMIRFKLVTATAMVDQYPNLPTINEPRGQ